MARSVKQIRALRKTIEMQLKEHGLLDILNTLEWICADRANTTLNPNWEKAERILTVATGEMSNTGL